MPEILWLFRERSADYPFTGGDQQLTATDPEAAEQLDWVFAPGESSLLSAAFGEEELASSLGRWRFGP